MADDLAPWDSPAPKEKPPWETSTEEMQGEEPSVGERLFKGATALGRGAGEYVAPLLPTGPKKAEAGLPAGAKPAQGKIKQKEIEGFDPVEFAGSMFGPGVIAGGVAKAAPQVPKLLQGGIIGALTGALEPTGKTITQPGFVEEKI